MSGSNTTGQVLGASTVVGTSSAVLVNTGHEVLAAVLLAVALMAAAVIVTVHWTKKAALRK
jgi:hypothetical protein